MRSWPIKIGSSLRRRTSLGNTLPDMIGRGRAADLFVPNRGPRRHWSVNDFWHSTDVSLFCSSSSRRSRALVAYGPTHRVCSSENWSLRFLSRRISRVEVYLHGRIGRSGGCDDVVLAERSEIPMFRWMPIAVATSIPAVADIPPPFLFPACCAQTR